MASYAALDIESTGMNPRKDRIVSLAVALLDSDLNVTSSFHHLFQPGVKIPPKATERHGITNQDVAGLGLFRDVALRMRSIVTAQPIIGYNVNFDLTMLHHEFRRNNVAGLPSGIRIIDPYLLFCDDQPRTLTAALKTYCDRDHVGAHDALQDTLATIDVLREQKRRRGVEAAIELSRPWHVPQMPYSFGGAP